MTLQAHKPLSIFMLTAALMAGAQHQALASDYLPAPEVQPRGTVVIPEQGTKNLNRQQESNTIPVGSQSPEHRQSMSLPTQGQTMHNVRTQLGEPAEVYEIGKPVITRWNYQDVTVYFESGRVLRAVVHNQP